MATAKDKIKIVVVGDGAVGKTSLLFTLTKGEPPTEYVPTVFDNHETDLTVDGRECFLSLWDTAGQEEFAHIRPLNYPDTSVFLICFSVESSASMDNIKLMWLPELNEKAHGVPFIIVGTKCDLRQDASLLKTRADQGKPVRSYDDNKALAEQLGAKGFMECSAFKKVNINTIFEEAVRVARVDREQKELKKMEELAALKNRRQSTQGRDAKSRGSVSKAAPGGGLIPTAESSGGSCCLLM